MAQSTSHQIRADQAMTAAENDELLFVDDYKLQAATNTFRMTLPDFFVTNTRFNPGDFAGCYVDFDRGMVVYDFQEGDYER